MQYNLGVTCDSCRYKKAPKKGRIHKKNGGTSMTDGKTEKSIKSFTLFNLKKIRM